MKMKHDSQNAVVISIRERKKGSKNWGTCKSFTIYETTRIEVAKIVKKALEKACKN